MPEEEALASPSTVLSHTQQQRPLDNINHPRPLTRKPIDKPGQLLFGDVGPTEVQADWLPLDDATQGLGNNGLAPAQINLCPESLVTAPRKGEDKQSPIC